MAKKTSSTTDKKASKCPFSRKELSDLVASGKVPPLEIKVGTQTVNAEFRQFSTGSFGFYFNGKVPTSVDGKAVSLQVGANLTIVGSKESE